MSYKFITKNKKYTPMSSPGNSGVAIDSTVLKAIELGTRLFKSGEYLQAKRIFTNALRVCDSYSHEQIMRIRNAYQLDTARPDNKRLYHPRYIKILDNICACYEKLNDLKSCLDVSQRLLKLEPGNIKCYIRCTRTLIKLKDWKRAYKTCSRGLQLCNNDSNHLRQQKQFIKNNMVQKQDGKRSYINPSEETQIAKKKKNNNFLESLPKKKIKGSTKKTDLVGNLPIEILPIIFQRFTTKELVTLSLVCNKWRDKILYHLDCFQEFNLAPINFKNFVKFMDFLQQNFTRTYRKYILSQVKVSSRITSEELRITQLLFSKMPKCINIERLILSMPTLTTTQIFKLMVRGGTDFFARLLELSLMITYRPDKQHELEILQTCPLLKKIELIFVNSLVPIFDGNNSVGRDGSFNVMARHTNMQIPTVDNDEQGIVEEKVIYSELEKITLICDKKKIKNFPLCRALLRGQFPLLQKLTITGVTFPMNNQDIINFQWLLNFPDLKELWIEDNDNCELSKFLQLLKFSNVWKNLEKLTFRENKLYPIINLDEDQPVTNDNEVPSMLFYKENLQNLEKLDLMGTSISGSALTRLCEQEYLDGRKLRSLNIGNCPNIQFPNNHAHAARMILDVNAVLKRLSKLEEINLSHLSSLNDSTMKSFIINVPFLENLKRLDISHNFEITGISIYEFLKKFQMDHDNEAGGQPLAYLNIDGCSQVSHITVNMIRAQNLVTQVDCVYERDVWRKFGINSYSYS
ncbi:AHL_G0050220.mRNA.1.CDS.1 [Saccharomyces cerevisiae]|nr:AHL_G0050220.mRNA.1.CDS.1 [Saccharomyces cerevisiae]CAI6883902.1 AHL_G0050220.mRNA.1.CDS.1 [Saccharomyces cerevisiae]